MNKLRGVVQRIILGAIAFLFVVACNGNRVTTELATSTDCRIVRHTKGETCVPNNPQRIVTLGGIENLLALGIQPIGSDLSNPDPHLQGKLEGIINVGRDLGEPSIEAILTLKPDLIIAEDYLSVDYQILSNIAPTIIISFEHSGRWKNVFMEYAAALGKTDKAQQVMTDYYARLEDFRRQYSGTPDQLQVSIVRVYPDRVNLYLKDSFCGTVVADAGLSRPPAQNFDAAQAQARFGNSIQYSIAKERIKDADGDVMFLWATGANQEIERQAQSAKAALKADLLWSRLKAVKTNRVYEVPGYWIGNGPLAANAIVDDLFKYLIEAQSNASDKTLKQHAMSTPEKT